MGCVDGGRGVARHQVFCRMSRHAASGVVLAAIAFHTAIRLFVVLGTWHLVLADTSINGMGVRELDDGPAVLELDADGAVG